MIELTNNINIYIDLWVGDTRESLEERYDWLYDVAMKQFGGEPVTDIIIDGPVISFPSFVSWANRVELLLPEGFPGANKLISEDGLTETKSTISNSGNLPPIVRPLRNSGKSDFTIAIIEKFRLTTESLGNPREIRLWLINEHSKGNELGEYGLVEVDGDTIHSKLTSISITFDTIKNRLGLK